MMYQVTDFLRLCYFSCIEYCRRTRLDEEILAIKIKPGLNKGTKITFKEKGNKKPSVIPADVAFIVDEKPHDVFTRYGDDLMMTKTVSLAEALTGYTVCVTTLDGRSLTIPISNVIQHGHEEVIHGEGMPLSKEPTRKGNLTIKFNVKFPARLTEEQKVGIRRLSEGLC